MKDQRQSVGDLSGPHIPWEIEIRDPPLLGDAKVWMELADMLHRKNKILREGEQLNELSVANVCAGYAFEFVFKVLVEAATMEQAAAGHNPSDAYRILKEKNKVVRLKSTE